MRSDGDVLFHEWQPLRVNLMALVALLVTFAAVLVAVVFESRDGWTMDLVVGMAGLALVVVLVLTGGLRTTVRSDALVLFWFPVRRRVVRPADVAAVEEVEYRPGVHFGGWGIRFGGKTRGWAYSVAGRHGVRVTLQDGRLLLVGSRRAEALAQALREASGLRG